jgi:aromatic ring-opening dioxygenase LigB subunit
MPLVYAALLPHPRIRLDSPMPKQVLEPTVNGFARVRKDITKAEIKTVILVSLQPLNVLHPYVTRTLDANAFYVTALDKLQVSLPTLDPKREPVVFDNAASLGRHLKSRLSAFGVRINLLPEVQLDEQRAISLAMLDLPAPTPRLLSITLPYRNPSELIDFGKLLGSALQSEKELIALLAIGNLSARLTPEAAAGFSPKAQEFDDGFVAAAKAPGNKLPTVLASDVRTLEEVGEDAVRPLAVVSGAIGDTPPLFISYQAHQGVGYSVVTWSSSK